MMKQNNKQKRGKKKMNTIDILVVVDTEGAASSGNLSDNVYLIDSTKYLGSWREGQCELVTACHDTQKIRWTVTPVNADDDVDISAFTGQIINSKICVPKKLDGDDIWEGVVETQGATGTYQYSLTLSIDGKNYSFDPFLNVIL